MAGLWAVAGRELLLWLHLLFHTYEGARGLCPCHELDPQVHEGRSETPQGRRAASRVLASAWSMSGPAGDGGAVLGPAASSRKPPGLFSRALLVEGTLRQRTVAVWLCSQNPLQFFRPFLNLGSHSVSGPGGPRQVLCEWPIPGTPCPPCAAHVPTVHLLVGSRPPGHCSQQRCAAGLTAGSFPLSPAENVSILRTLRLT